MDLVADLRQALGLPDTAAVLANVKEPKTSSAHAALGPIAKAAGLAENAEATAVLQAVTNHVAAIGPIAKATGLPENATAAAVLQAVTDLADPLKRVPADQVKALQAQFGALSASIALEKAEAAIDAAIAAGKPGVKALRDHYIARHQADPAGVAKELGALPSLTGRSGASAVPPGKDGLPGLDPDEARVVALMGIDPKEYTKTKAADATREETL